MVLWIQNYSADTFPQRLAILRKRNRRHVTCHLQFCERRLSLRRSFFTPLLLAKFLKDGVVESLIETRSASCCRLCLLRVTRPAVDSPFWRNRAIDSSCIYRCLLSSIAPTNRPACSSSA